MRKTLTEVFLFVTFQLLILCAFVYPVTGLLFVFDGPGARLVAE